MSGARREPGEDEGRIGPFPSWRALYAAVIVYTVVLVVLLWAAGRLLDHAG